MLTVRAAARHAQAMAAVDELLAKLRIEHLFVGAVARAAWLGGEVDAGAVDVLGLMQSPQKNSVAMMAANRGFAVDREEVEATEELDLIPLAFEGVRVHVLVASNALYARMFGAARHAACGERELRVPAAEDLALLLALSGDGEAVRALVAAPEFDVAAYNEKLSSIGLRGAAVVAERA